MWHSFTKQTKPKPGFPFRAVWLISICLLPACDALSFIAPLALPDGLSRVSGGMADNRPYFGKSFDAGNGELGQFVLATCGCGDWRVLLKDSNGDQRQFAVSFYDTGTYDPDGEVTFFGREGDLAALGTMHQGDGAAAGQIDLPVFRRTFSADRRATHTNDIEACILCHIGENPIYPQPDTHIEYVPGVTNCLECHEVVIE